MVGEDSRVCFEEGLGVDLVKVEDAGNRVVGWGNSRCKVRGSMVG